MKPYKWTPIPSGRVLTIWRDKENVHGPGVYVTIKLDDLSPVPDLYDHFTGQPKPRAVPAGELPDLDKEPV